MLPPLFINYKKEFEFLVYFLNVEQRERPVSHCVFNFCATRDVITFIISIIFNGLLDLQLNCQIIFGFYIFALDLIC